MTGDLPTSRASGTQPAAAASSDSRSPSSPRTNHQLLADLADLADLAERDQDLAAARAANRELMARFNARN